MPFALVSSGAPIRCSFGAVPSLLNVLPTACTMSGNMPMASIMDFQPMVHVPPFGMCMSTSNPTVVSATAAAMGVLTPMPCTPAFLAPWIPGVFNVWIGGKPALHSGCQLLCALGGTVQIVTSPCLNIVSG